MTFARSAIAIAVATTGMSVAAGRADAASYHHIDLLAVKLQAQSRRLLTEFSLHYRHAAHFRHLYSDAARMYKLAAHIHDVAHHHGSLHHLQSDLRELDRLYHHIEGLLRHIHRDAAHGIGHTHGHTGHVWSLMRSTSYTLHHLKSDIDAMVRAHHSHSVRGGHGIHGGHSVHGHRGRGVTIRRGNFGLRIRF